MKPGTYCIPCGEQDIPRMADVEFDGDPMCHPHARLAGWNPDKTPRLPSPVPAVNAARDREERKEARRDLKATVDFAVNQERQSPQLTSVGVATPSAARGRQCKRGCNGPAHPGRRCDGTAWSRGTVQAISGEQVRMDPGVVMGPEFSEASMRSIPTSQVPDIVLYEKRQSEDEFATIPLAEVPALPKYTAGGGRMGRFWRALLALPPGQALVLKTTGLRKAGAFVSQLNRKARDNKIAVEYRRDGGTVYAWVKAGK